MRAVQGIGVGLRTAFVRELLATRRAVDWLEIVPENWMFYGGQKRAWLREAAARWPVVPHSTSLDVGGLAPLDDRLLGALEALTAELDAPYWSDHVCFSSVDGRPLHDLLPLPFTAEAAQVVGRRASEAAARVGRPLVLENATFYVQMPAAAEDGRMGELDFLTECLRQSGATLLLDVNNVYVNARNHGFSAESFLDAVPLEQVTYLHLAGHTQEDGVIIDTHIGPVIDEVWALYRRVLRRAGRLIPTLIEWDQDLPPLDVVLDEVDRARAEADRALGGDA